MLNITPFSFLAVQLWVLSSTPGSLTLINHIGTYFHLPCLCGGTVTSGEGCCCEWRWRQLYQQDLLELAGWSSKILVVWEKAYVPSICPLALMSEQLFFFCDPGLFRVSWQLSSTESSPCVLCFHHCVSPWSCREDNRHYGLSAAPLCPKGGWSPVSLLCDEVHCVLQMCICR